MTTTITPRGFHLGKNPGITPEHIELKTFFETPLTAPAGGAHYGHAVKAAWQMNGNGPDPLITIPGTPPNWGGCGDCVESAKAHELLTSNYDEDENATDFVPGPIPNAVVLAYCEEVGCTPEQLFSDPNTYDTGLDIPTSLATWRKAPQLGDQLGLYATVDPSSQTDLETALWLAGGLLIGIQLRANNENEFPLTWTWDANSQILGGHAVWLTGYTSELVWLVTWGQLIASTWENILNSIDEAYALGSAQAITAGRGPTGLSIPAWTTALDQLAA